MEPFGFFAAHVVVLEFVVLFSILIHHPKSLETIDRALHDRMSLSIDRNFQLVRDVRKLQ
jgi:hypothetical protein